MCAKPDWLAILMQSCSFVMKTRHFKAQYAQMYFARLMELGTALKAQAAKRWPDIAGAASAVLQFVK